MNLSEGKFPDGMLELSAASRRRILKLMGASFGLAGLTACRRPVEKILPAVKGVEDYIPGNPLYYATAAPVAGSVAGLLVETHDGRPTKIEGNPRHPSSGGAASAFAQAEILSLYDPDRSQAVLRGGEKSSWEEFARAVREMRGKVRFLSSRVASPSLASMRKIALEKFPGSAWVEYEPVSDREVLAGAQLAFGQPLQPHYHFDKAEAILALDADVLGLDAPSQAAIRAFSRRRGASSNRLYAAESQFSITGAMADHRLRMCSGDIARFAQELPAGSHPIWKDLAAHKGRSLVVAGPRQPAVVHALAHWLNAQLGNLGETVTFTAAPAPGLSIAELAQEMSRGEVGALVVLGGNPAYDAPADTNFAGGMKKVPLSIHLGLDLNETAKLASWHLPEAHFLEAWGDVRAADGTVSIQQPLIQPLYGGKTAVEVVALLAGHRDQRAYDIVRGLWQAQWRKSLHEGIVEGTRSAEVKPALKFTPAPLPNRDRQGAVEITFHPSWSAWDGRYANHAWLQETPDPMTKLTWDNAALLSPATARSLGVETGDVIALERAGRRIEAAVMTMPGQADHSIALPLGYGRASVGRVGKGVGFNANPLRSSDAMWIASGVKVTKTGRKRKLVTTQEHHSMEGRPLVREGSVSQHEHGPKLFSLYEEHKYDQGNQWGMVIDLNACIGCNACVVACQAENNIPVVGKEQVANGREMHWLRLDRYFTGPPEEPRAVVQPVACAQCENAPCESVCPVAATTHSPEGLNDMAYNRCVGTRYCANNCPYKVRRFNFLDYHKDLVEIGKMQFNPDVTVRMRGVMEKCTYCVQRIQEAKIHAKADGHRPLKDGEVVTACQQTCPAEAISFGNLLDPNSRVSKLRAADRNYALLGELNTKPRTTYLARLRNPNPELENHG
ncbi:MAG: 4Fe-4S dicluster domain-containing protein [Acidobacteria bacterium]|nr:4Fe-4S dicluster domain-containing protein [Acidobacteriota bacterium]